MQRQDRGTDRRRIAPDRAAHQARRLARFGRGRRPASRPACAISWSSTGRGRVPSMTTAGTSSTRTADSSGSHQGVRGVLQPLVHGRMARPRAGRRAARGSRPAGREPRRWRIRALTEARVSAISGRPSGPGRGAQPRRAGRHQAEVAGIGVDAAAIVAAQDHPAAERGADEHVEEVVERAVLALEQLGHRRGRAVVLAEHLEAGGFGQGSRPGRTRSSAGRRPAGCRARAASCRDCRAWRRPGRRAGRRPGPRSGGAGRPRSRLRTPPPPRASGTPAPGGGARSPGRRSRPAARPASGARA